MMTYATYRDAGQCANTPGVGPMEELVHDAA